MTPPLALPQIGLGCANILTADLPTLIEAAERAGFRRITVHPRAFADAEENGWTKAALQQRLADSGMQVTMIDALSTRLPGIPPRSNLDAATRAALPAAVTRAPDEETGFRAAEVLGAPTVNLTHYLGVPTPVEELADAVAGVCRRAAAHGLTVCLEFIPDTGIPDIATAQAVIDACQEPNIGILLDLFHHDRSGGTVDDIKRLPLGAIAAVQLSDRVPPPPGTPHVPLTGRVLPGEGVLPLAELLVAALDNNGEVSVDVEVLNREIAALPPTEAATCLADGVNRWRTSIGA